jgi:predicted nucleic acid-binding protein
MAILVDTSVWIDFFDGRPTAQVTRLKRFVGVEELLIGDLILAEILQGIANDKEVKRVEAAFAAFRVVPLVGERMARQSASHYRYLRKQGITIRKMIDCLIAAWCIENRVALLHADRDFHPFTRLGLTEA